MADDEFRNLMRGSNAPQAADDESGLPSSPVGDYKPYSAPANRPVFAMHCIRPSGEIRSFQYVDLDSDSRYEPGVIVLRFTGTKVLEVVIHGRNLWRLYDGIHRQVIRWVMETARDFAQNGESVVNRLEIREVKKDLAEQLEEESA
jgi:hypothetical protein